jgi:hypothetical protein
MTTPLCNRGDKSKSAARIPSLSISYAIAEKGVRDWDQALPIEGSRAMYGESRKNLKEDIERPPALSPQPISPGIEREGYRFNGKSYMRRAPWNTALNFGESADNKLIVLAGYDRNILSHGAFTLDVFDGDPDRRIVAIDAESSTPIEDRLRQVSIVNSRWLVVGLDLNLRELLLFDFKPAKATGK